MKTINASANLLSHPEPTDKMGVLKYIEKIGRTCYKSEDKITDESCIKFVKMLRDRKHWAMLEHYRFVFEVDVDTYTELLVDREDNSENPDINCHYKFIDITCHENDKGESVYLVSASATAINYLWNDLPEGGIAKIGLFMTEHYPELMAVPTEYSDKFVYDIRFVTSFELSTYPMNIQLTHRWMSALFTVDSGISHELLRHRPASWAQESSRYCNYQNSKFGSEVTFIKPVFYKKALDEAEIKRYARWIQACETSEQCYINMINNGASPQEARDVLCRSMKTEVNMTANFQEFRHFFKMRADMAAHPQMREVAVPLLAQAIDAYPEVFSDMKERLNNHV